MQRASVLLSLLSVLALLGVQGARAEVWNSTQEFNQPVTVNSTLTYGATVWDDSMVPALSVRAGATAPDDCNFLGDSTLVKTSCFDGTTIVEEVHFLVQIPHGYKVGSTLKPHVHWTPTTTGAGNVVWQLEYTVSEIGGTFPAAQTVACTATAAGGTAWVHKISACPDIADATLGISSVMYGRLFRDGAHTSDTYEADSAMIGFDIHFEADTAGSSAATSK